MSVKCEAHKNVKAPCCPICLERELREVWIELGDKEQEITYLKLRLEEYENDK